MSEPPHGPGLSARVFRNSLWLFGGQMGARLVGLAISILVARSLGSESFGHYTYLLTLTNIGFLAAQYGLDRLLMRLIAREPEQATAHVAAGAATRLAIVAAAVPFLLLAAVLGHRPTEVRLAVGIVAVALVFYAIAQTFENAYTGLERMGVPSVARFVSKLAQLAVVAVAVHFALGFAWFFAALAASEAARAIAMAAAWRRGRSFKPVPGELRRFLRDGLPFFGVVMGAGMAMRMELFLMGFLGDPRMLGRYGAAYTVAEAFLLISTAVTTSLFPSFARFARDRDAAGIARAYSRSAGLLAVVALPIAVSLTILAPKAVATIYGREFAPAAAALAILVWNVPLAFITAPLNRILEAWDGERALFKVLGGVCALGLPCALWSIAHFGLPGAAASNVAMRVVLSALLVVIVGRRIPGMAYPIGTVLRCLPGAAMLAAACWFLREASWAVVVPAGVAAYGAGVLACRAVSVGEMMALVRKRQPKDEAEARTVGREP